MNREQLVELLQDSILNHIDLDSGGYSPPLDRQVGLIVDTLWPVLAQVWDEGFSEAERHVERDTPIRNPYSEVPA